MKHTKKLGLLSVAVAALMAFAGSAPATELTSPEGTKLGVGTQLKAENVGAVKLDGTVTISCQEASGEGEVTNAGGPSATVGGILIFGTYGKCGTTTVTVVKTGTGEIHSLGNGNATATSTGAVVTALTHNILGTIHCIYDTNATDVGTATGTKTTKGTVTMDINVPIPQAETDSFCGNDAQLTAQGVLTTPDTVYFD